MHPDYLLGGKLTDIIDVDPELVHQRLVGVEEQREVL